MKRILITFVFIIMILNSTGLADFLNVSMDSSEDINPCLLRGPQNSFYLLWQSNRTGTWDIYMKSYNGIAWSETIVLTSDTLNNEDVRAVFDKNEKLWFTYISSQPDDIYNFHYSFIKTYYEDQIVLVTGIIPSVPGPYWAYPSIQCDSDNIIHFAFCNYDEVIYFTSNGIQQKIYSFYPKKTSIQLLNDIPWIIYGENGDVPGFDFSFVNANYKTADQEWQKIFIDRSGSDYPDMKDVEFCTATTDNEGHIFSADFNGHGNKWKYLIHKIDGTTTNKLACWQLDSVQTSYYSKPGYPKLTADSGRVVSTFYNYETGAMTFRICDGENWMIEQPVPGVDQYYNKDSDYANLLIGNTVYTAFSSKVTGNAEIYISIAEASKTIDEKIVATDIESDPESVITNYQLNQNYPNPFNPATSISYSLSKTEQVTLSVYDVLGRQVQVLVNRQQIAGKYTAEWNAGNSPSGVYFYRLQTGAVDLVKKMLLVR